MGDNPKTPRSPAAELSIFGISKSKGIAKACKSLVKKWNPDHKLHHYKKDEKSRHKKGTSKVHNHDDSNDDPTTPFNFDHVQNQYQCGNVEVRSSLLSSLSRNSSRRSKTPSPLTRSLSGSISRRSITPTFLSRITNRKSTSKQEPTSPGARISKNTSRKFSSENENPSRNLSRNASVRDTTPIIFSQSNVKKIPAPIERKIECTLDDLCYGCVKNIKIIRDVIKPVGIVKEEEVLKIEVKPGWRKGTKITFEEKGDEKPGFLPADIIFVIEEKRHALFYRKGDDLEMCIQVSLVKSLTGCSITVPLLGKEKLNLTFEDSIIYPGFQKLIQGQGMPKLKQNRKRGDLRIRFHVNFPTELSDEQRQEAVSILQNCA